GRPLAVEHLDKLARPGPDRRRAGVREHHHTRLAVRTRDEARVVEPHVREADPAVEVLRRLHVGDADADVIHAAKRGHAAAGAWSNANSTRTARISASDCGSSTGRRGLRGSPPGWPSIFLIAFS